MNEYIKNLIKDGVSMTVTVSESRYGDFKDKFVYDLNTGMKGHCYATDMGDGILYLEGRYGWNELYNTNENSYEDFVKHVVRNCSHGESYYNGCWDNVLKKFDVYLGE